VSVPTAAAGSAPGPGFNGAVSVQATFAATLVDEWVRCGITEAVVCPGSRSTPLALALALGEGFGCHVRLDERSAGFFAIGLAQVTGRAVVMCTTSGTAAAELHAAVIEAHHARVPLIVCTADRPPELHHVGAPQTIDQTNLYSNATRWFCEPGVARQDTERTWRPLAARAVAEAEAGPIGPGPVHLNLAFADPLVGVPGPLPAGRTDRRPISSVRPLMAGPGATSGVASWPGRRGIVVAGEGCGPADDVLALGERLGWPVLADPRSGCRLDHRVVVAAADALLRPAAVRCALQPEVVLVLGAPWASKTVAGFLAEVAGDAEVVAVDPWWRWRDPEHTVGVVHLADPGVWVAAALAELGPGNQAAGWLNRWQTAERAAQQAIDVVLAADEAARGGALSEPALARRLLRALPPGTRVVASSSMPVRHLEWFAPPMASPPPVLSNRGANGIDGVSSTALGAAAAGRGPVVGLVGDLAFLHDLSALVGPLAPPKGPTSCTLVVLDNAGGGIFSFLPQATSVDPGRFEQLFATPQAPDIAQVAAGFGVPVADVADIGQFEAALDAMVGRAPLAVICVRVPERAANVALHDRIHAEVAASVAAAFGTGTTPPPR